MKNISLLTLLFIGFSFYGTSQVPINDDCADAIDLGLGEIPVSTFNSSFQYYTNCSRDNSIWFTITSNRDTGYTINSCLDSSFVYYTLYDAENCFEIENQDMAFINTCGNQYYFCEQDNNGSSITFFAEQGNRYYLELGTSQPDSFRLEVIQHEMVPLPQNSRCENANVITYGTSKVSAVNTLQYSEDYHACSSEFDSWYLFHVNKDSNYRFYLNQLDEEMNVVIFKMDDCSNQSFNTIEACFASTTDTSIIENWRYINDLKQGDQLYFKVSQKGLSDTANAELRIEYSPGTSGNDHCDDAIALELNESQPFRNFGADTDFDPSCYVPYGVWYTFSPEKDTNYRVSACESITPLLYAVISHNGSCATINKNQVLGCELKTCGINNSYDFYGYAGNTYFIYVGSQLMTTAEIQVSYSEHNLPPDNDVCELATDIYLGDTISIEYNNLAQTSNPSFTRCNIKMDQWYRWYCDSTAAYYFTTTDWGSIYHPPSFEILEGESCDQLSVSNSFGCVRTYVGGNYMQYFEAEKGKYYFIRAGFQDIYNPDYEVISYKIGIKKPIPLNDHYTEAQLLELNEVYEFNNEEATTDAISKCNYKNGVWYKFNCEVNSTYEFNACEAEAEIFVEFFKTHFNGNIRTDSSWCEAGNCINELGTNYIFEGEAGKSYYFHVASSNYTDYRFHKGNGAATILDLDNNVGIEELTDKEIHLYPTPSSGVINIDFPLDNYKLEMFNLLGERVLVKTLSAVSNAKINCSSLDVGIYLITLNNGKQQFVKKALINY